MAVAPARTKTVSEYKIRKVEEIKEILNNYSVIALAHISQIGSKMLQEIRKNLRGTIGIKIIKNNLFKIAIDETNRKNISKLKDYIDGATALIYSNENPFRVKRLIEKNRSKAPAKSGMVSPIDIVIEKGDTGFPPGPVITELNEVGLKTRIRGGTVWVEQDTVVAKKGEVISPMLAIVLSRLDIRPIELGLELYAAYDGDIYTSEDLDIDFEDIINNLSSAVCYAHNLAVNIGYPTPETITPIIQKAYLNAKNLVLGAGIIVKEFIPELISLANAKSVALAKEIIKINPEALPENIIAQFAAPVSSETTETETKKEEKAEEKEKPKEEDTSIGLGGLFG